MPGRANAARVTCFMMLPTRDEGALARGAHGSATDDFHFDTDIP